MPDKMPLHKRVILCVTNDLSSDQRVHKICTSLVKHDFHLMLIGRQLPNSLPLKERNYITKRLSLAFTSGFLFYAEYNWRLFFFLIKQKAQILVANDLDTLPAVFFASIVARVPFVYDSHEYFTEVPELENRKFVKTIWKTIERLFIRKAKKSYTVCESIANIYHQKYGIDMQVVRNVPKLSPHPYTSLPFLYPENKHIVLYQGAVNVGRGIEQVIRAMKYVEGAVFVVIGNGDIIRPLKQLTLDLELLDKVLFTGQIPFDDLPQYTMNSHLGISLEQNLGLSYYYSLPNKLFDYIAAGVPVLASSFPEIKKIVENYGIGLLTDNYEEEHLADMINFMLNDTDSREFWKANLINAAKELNWENEEEKLFAVYDALE